MKNILLAGNLVYIKLDTTTSFGSNADDPLYIAGSVSGNLFMGSIYPYSVIIARYPDIHQVDSLLKLSDVYHERNYTVKG